MISQLPVLLDLAKEALLLGLMIAAPLLAVLLAVGVVAGLLQAVTQIHEGTISLTARLVAGGVTAAAVLPWMLSRLSEFAAEVFSGLAYR